MIATFTVLKPKYTRREKLVALLVVLPLILLFAAMIINKNAVWIVAAGISFPCILMGVRLPSLREEPYCYLDKKIVFGSDSIIINDEAFEIAQLENLSLRLREYDGLEFKGKTTYTMNGTDNYLFFVSIRLNMITLFISIRRCSSMILKLC